VLPTDTFFADVEKVIAEFDGSDHSRLRTFIAELEHIAERVPRVAERCYAYQARLYAKLQEHEQALAAVERALQLMPLDDNLILLRGDIHRAAQEFSQALADYAHVLEVRPDSVTARMRLAEVHQTKGNYQAALQDLNEALKLEPRSLRLLYRRGLVLVDLHRSAEAIVDFKSVAQLSPDPDLKRKAEQRLRELGER